MDYEGNTQNRSTITQKPKNRKEKKLMNSKICFRTLRISWGDEKKLAEWSNFFLDFQRISKTKNCKNRKTYFSIVIDINDLVNPNQICIVITLY